MNAYFKLPVIYSNNKSFPNDSQCSLRMFFNNILDTNIMIISTDMYI